MPLYNERERFFSENGGTVHPTPQQMLDYYDQLATQYIWRPGRDDASFVEECRGLPFSEQTDRVMNRYDHVTQEATLLEVRCGLHSWEGEYDRQLWILLFTNGHRTYRYSPLKGAIFKDARNMETQLALSAIRKENTLTLEMWRKTGRTPFVNALGHLVMDVQSAMMPGYWYLSDDK